MKFDYTKQPGLYLWNNMFESDGHPLISVITAYYNTGKCFEQTFNSVMNQTFPWFEWIIVDDGTTDKGSLDRLEKLGALDKRIKIIHQKNAGLSAARNTGINESSTDFIFPLDSDDIIEPTCLEYEYWALHFNPEATWAYSDSVGFEGQEYLWDVKFDPERLRKENHLPATALIRKKDALEVGNYTVKDFPFNEDWHFWLKLLAKGKYPVQIKGEYLFWYRRGEEGVLASVRKDDENREKNRKVISEAADMVVQPRQPICFPLNICKPYIAPKESTWNKHVYSQNEKIHILFLFPWFSMGGADKFNLDLIKKIDKNKFAISIITTEKGDNDWLQLFREETPEIFNLPNFMSANDYPEFIDYFIKSRDIDILFASNSTDGYYLLPWIRKNHPELAIIDYVHMEEWYWRNGGHARSSAVMGEIVERTYVCNSATREVMINQFQRKPESVETVHIGIDENRYDAKAIREGILYQELNIDNNRPVVLFICRLHPQKRPFLMIEIAKQVRKKIKNVAFAVVGDGPQKEELVETVKARGLEGTVYFLGAKEEVRPYYKDAKVTLICSIKEGLALTAYESCAMGIPVVSADVGGQKDLIDDSVEKLIPFMQKEDKDFDSRYFSDKEIKAYSEAIVEILSDVNKWNVLSVNCRNKIEKGFTIDAMVQYFEKEFQRILLDPTMIKMRKDKSEFLKKLGMFPGELYTASLMEQGKSHPEENAYVKGERENIGERLTREEKTVIRHEQSINHQWEIQKWHEERIRRLEGERSIFAKCKSKIRRLLRNNE